LVQPDVAGNGVQVLTGGTQVHLVLVDLRNAPIDGKTAENLLHEVGITVNRNSVPNDPRPPMVTSGVRIGTPALATRGFGPAEFAEVAEVIAGVMLPNPDIDALRARTKALADKFPLYAGLENW
jgi:glycine hydroxymethyltransferase